jgi:hypothetical protein
MRRSLIILGTLAAGCAPSDEQPLVLDAGSPPDTAVEVIAQPVPESAPALCHRPGSDRVRDVFCAPNPPVIDSLRSLQIALKLGPAAFTLDEQNSYVSGAYVGILLGHSTAAKHGMAGGAGL